MGSGQVLIGWVSAEGVTQPCMLRYQLFGLAPAHETRSPIPQLGLFHEMVAVTPVLLRLTLFGE